eukprot:Skav211683  [mRNA]  locus=scaffold216:422171:433625:- [translate_table: standard]
MGKTVITCNAVISACEKAGRWQLAWQVLLVGELKRQRLRPSVVTYGAAISACEKGGQWQHALQIFSELQSAALQAHGATEARCCADSRDYHERIQYHADRFTGKGRTEQVLRRYERRRPSASILELQKCAFHIASWVVKLEHRMTSKDGEDLSAVSLLVQYLELLNARKDVKPLCNQLLTLLKTVLEHSSGSASEQWKLLSDHISLLLEPQVPPQHSSSDVFQMEENSKAVRLLQKAVQIWRSEMDQAAYVASLEEALHAVGTDLKKVRLIFRRAVAALSPPRLASGEGNSDGMQQTEGTSTDFQHRLRKVVLSCLDYLDLTDPKIQPSLQLLECLLQNFQELTGTVLGRRQWIRLQAKSSPVSTEGTVASAQDHAIKQAFERKRKLCEHKLRKDRCRSCQPWLTAGGGQCVAGLGRQANVISYSAFISCAPPWQRALYCLDETQENMTLEVYNAALALDGGAMHFLAAMEEQRFQPDLITSCSAVGGGVYGYWHQLRMHTMDMLRSHRPVISGSQL